MSQAVPKVLARADSGHSRAGGRHCYTVAAMPVDDEKTKQIPDVTPHAASTRQATPTTPVVRQMQTISPQDAARALALDDEYLLRQCDESFFVASGPGGQHRNKTETGVRLTHLPSGLTVTATERRSQLQNRGAALERLRQRLEQASVVPEKRVATRPSRASRRRRLNDKKHLSEKKKSRSSDW